MTGLGLISSDVNVDVKVSTGVTSETASTIPAGGSPAGSPAEPVTEASSVGADGTQAAHAAVKSGAGLPPAWSAARAMVKIAEILRAESAIYQNVETDFQVRNITVQF